MIEYGLWLSVALACIPAWGGSRAALALLASFLYATALLALGVPFSWLQWIAADLFVLKAIVSSNMSLQEELVAALFLPAWASYALSPVMLYEISTGVVILQFLICLPWPALQKTSGEVTHGSVKDNQGGMCGI